MIFFIFFTTSKKYIHLKINDNIFLKKKSKFYLTKKCFSWINFNKHEKIYKVFFYVC